MNLQENYFNDLKTQIAQIQQELNSLPDGKLICSHNGKYYKWYHSQNGKYIYIPKSNRVLAQQLARKKYLTLLLAELTNEQQHAQQLLTQQRSRNRLSEQFLLQNPEYRTLLQPFFTPMSQELSLWMNSPYEQNPKHPEHLIHQTISGISVRSKSESMIASALSQQKIPFRYECRLILNTVTLYPDFTIRHPKTGSYYYWEHFGLMNQTAYITSCFSKQQLYASCEIIPTIQLITTYETPEHPLSIQKINTTIQQYFG